MATLLVDIVGEAVPCGDLPGARWTFQTASGCWALNGDTGQKYQRLFTECLRESEWQRKFSHRYIEKRVDELVMGGLVHQDAAELRRECEVFAETLDNFNTEQTVYVPIAGIAGLSRPLRLGRVRLVPMTERRVAHITRRLRSVIMHTRNPVRQRRQFVRRNRDDIRTAYLGRICAEFRTVAEVGKAREVADDAVAEAIDLLRFSLPVIHGRSPRVVIDAGSDAIENTLLKVTISRDLSMASIDDSILSSGYAVHLGPEAIEKMKKIGVFRLARLFATDRAKLTEVQENILRAVHWIADSQIQRQNENALISLVVSLEALFTQESGVPISATISDGVAFLLGSTRQDRMKIKGIVRDMYDKRSRIAHGEAAQISIEDIRLLTDMAGNSVIALLRRAKRLRFRKDVYQWIEARRLG